MSDPLLDFKKSINNLRNSLNNIISKKLNLRKQKSSRLFDFRQNKEDYIRASISNSVKELKSSAWALSSIYNINKSNEQNIIKILELVIKTEKKYEMSNFEDMVSCIDDIAEITALLKSKAVKEDELNFDIPALPSSIEPDVMADIRELKRCFNAKCYRSSTILCGRILETALHRKYFEATNKDILETSPGIGLGSLIAKLNDKIEFDPGIKDQIHLINKVRISSVHKKKEAFFPTRQQAYAIILYTLDILKKLFKN
ncbi:MAG: DUF4145 domain-containing protein [Nanoarchaeota archaeon]|nr:DUF4145 domain-containing protein [Nanoarchaeota archaeon]